MRVCILGSGSELLFMSSSFELSPWVATGFGLGRRKSYGDYA
jgi:hypothetical protein